MVSYHLRNILSALRNADQNYSLIDEGDKIVVGISGGKDSLTLLYALSLYGRFAKKNFTLYPVLLDLGFQDTYDFQPLKDFVSSLGLELEIIDARFVYPALEAHTKPGKHLSCSLCSRMKKAAMKDAAEKKKANKIAFAHHQDDLLETLFMNILHSGKVSTFTPKMVWEKQGITFIRPLFNVEEKEIRSLAKEMNFPILDLACPANHHTEREDTKEFLSSLYKKNPDYKKNLFKSLLNYDGFELPFSYLETTIEENKEYSLKRIVSPLEMRGTKLSQKKRKEGEIDFLILKKHKKVGEISYRMIRNHIYEIFNLDGNKESQVLAIKELVHEISKKSIPATFILKGVRKDIAESSSFQKKKDFSIEGIHYIFKTKSF